MQIKCIICLGAIQPPYTYIDSRLLCGHRNMHQKCLDKWMLVSVTCPICRAIDPLKSIMKKFRKKRTRIIEQSRCKLRKIHDAEQCLNQAVLIRNTIIRAKDLKPQQFERDLLLRKLQNIDQNHPDLL